MKKRPVDPQLYQKLLDGEKAFEEGRLSRREFNQLLALAATSAGVSLASMNPAFAWVATHMRKRSGTAAGASFAASYSLRFSSTSSAYLSRTPVGAGNQKTWTFSAWFKPGNMTSNSTQTLWGTGYATGTGSDMSLGYCWSSNKLNVYINSTNVLITNPEFRDPAAWYHIVLLIDTTSTIADLRNRLFVNGVEITSFSNRTNLSYNTNYPVNSAIQHSIGAVATPNYYLDGALSEVYFIDGQALLPSSFAGNDGVTGQWAPKQYSGSFGTNGFYLPFKSASAVNGSGTASGSYPSVTGVAGLGADYSGLNNHFSGSGLSVADRLLDSPSNSYAALNPNWRHESYVHSYRDGNLKYYSTNGASAYSAFATQIMEVKTYYEATLPDGTTGSYPSVGAALATVTGSAQGNVSGTNSTIGGFGFDCSLSKLWVEGSVAYNGGVAFSAGDVVGVAYDPGTGKIWISRNGTWLNGGDPAAGTSPLGTVSAKPASQVPSGVSYNNRNIVFNFGQGGQSGLTYDSASGGSFKYTPPTGFKALSSANLPTPAIVRPSQYFTVATYTGNGASQRVGAVIPATSSYSVDRGLRFAAASSAALTRSPASTGSQTTWTWSCWVKRSSLNASGTQMLFSIENGSGAITGLGFYNDALYFAFANSSPQLITNAVYRDVCDWIHIVAAADSTQATSTDRLKIFVNGIQVTSFATATYPSQNATAQPQFNAASNTQYVGRNSSVSPSYFDGLMTEVYFVDGQSLAPSSFGQTDSASGDWTSKAYLGTYGTNGYYLNFADNSNTTSTTLGKDSSGNGNNWTPSGFTTNDSILDTPTKNFCTLNPSVKGSGATLSAGNLFWSASTSAGQSYTGGVLGTLPVNSGRWYFEYTAVSSPYSAEVGVIADGFQTGALSTTNTQGQYVYYGYSSGSFYSEGAGVSYGAAFTAGDVVGVAVDADAGTLTFYKNGVSQGTLANVLSRRTYYYPFVTPGSSAVTITGTFNFGQGGQSGLTYNSASGGAFKYAPPTGYKALCNSNLPAVSTDAFQSTPDLVWIKGRSGATDHALYDSVRGVTLDLVSSSNAAETTQPTGIVALTKTGFSTGSLAKLNTSGATYVAWMWKKGATPGFDIVTYTGNGSNSRQISHSLGTTPAFYLTKCRNSTNSSNGWNDWSAYHSKLPQIGAGTTNGPQPLWLMSNAAVSSGAGGFGGVPSASIFYPNQVNYDNVSGVPYVAYLWAEIPGFSKMGSYTGNGSSDGPFVWCGFRPAFILLKRSDAAYQWYMWDLQRDSVNPVSHELLASNAGAEYANSAELDLLSNGFKLRATFADLNASGGTYVFVAFAEAPFKYANSR